LSKRSVKKKYIIRKENNNINYDVDFKYVDRGSPVNLTSTIQLTADLEPLYFRIKGGTSRFSTVNDSVVINNNNAVIKVDDSSITKTLSGINFPVAGIFACHCTNAADSILEKT
jgi:hypothetical protein